MSFSSGTFLINSTGNPVTTGTTISSTWLNALTADLATGLSTCILKDGTQVLTANIPMGGFKLTGIAEGSALTDSVSVRQVQNNFGSNLTGVSGTNTVLGTATPTPAYNIGQRFTFIPAVTNTGAVTLNISSVGAGAVQWNGAALTGGELVAGTAVTVFVSAATPVFEIIGAWQFPDTRALVVGGTDATKKLRFEVDGLTTGTTRVVTMPDSDLTLPIVTTGTTGSTFTFDGAGGTSASITMTWQKIGNWITLNIPPVSATSGTGSMFLGSNTALTAAIRPAAGQDTIAGVITNNGAVVAAPGMIRVTTGGIVQIFRDGSGTAYTNAATGGLATVTSITYFIG